MTLENEAYRQSAFHNDRECKCGITKKKKNHKRRPICKNYFFFFVSSRPRYEGTL